MIDQLKSGFTWLYLAAKLRQLRAIAGDPNSAPARVAQANEEIRKLADSLYRDRECGPTALIARLEREGLEAAERILPRRTDAPATVGELMLPRTTALKITGGNWYVAPNGSCVFTDAFEQGRGIANCAMAARPPEEWIANTQLIAAAPDLFRACEAMLVVFECTRHPDLSLARAAIAKAGGGQ